VEEELKKKEQKEPLKAKEKYELYSHVRERERKRIDLLDVI